MALQPRPPIIAVLGHVDHGKTSLLDKIRNTNITARETGGITQSTGAWQVETKEGKRITFIDTPGHEAFSSMRSRGAKVADIVILVVAADDSIKPQTKESLKYILESGTPYVIAITKIDLPGANTEKVKADLAQDGVFLEGRGGDVPAVEVSNKTGQGIEDLLEVLTILADLNEISADPRGALEAPIIEAKRDKSRGSVVQAIVRNGTLSVGQTVDIEDMQVKIRGLFNQSGKPVKVALPGSPVEILGFDRLPGVGSVVGAKSDSTKKASKQLTVSEDGRPRVLIKADTLGSLEAILGSLPEGVDIVNAEVGDLIESDVLLAQTSGASILGFNIKADNAMLRLAEEAKVIVKTYKIIYELFDDLKKVIEGKVTIPEKILGKAEIIAEFPHNKESKIAGCRIIEGRLVKSDKARLVRAGEILGQIRILNIKKFKAEVDKLALGEEAGIYFKPQFDFKPGDVLELYNL